MYAIRSYYELDEGKLYSYKGNYSYYLEKREARIELEAVETGKAKQLFKKELEWIRRQPKARTTKSKSRIDDFQDIKHRASQRRKDHQVQLELNMERLGNNRITSYNVCYTKLLRTFPGISDHGRKAAFPVILRTSWMKLFRHALHK